MAPLDRHDQPLLTKEQDIARYPNKKKMHYHKTKMDQIGRANKIIFILNVFVACFISLECTMWFHIWSWFFSWG